MSTAGKKRAVVLVSGGMDSAVVLAIAKEQGFEPYALSVRYGQRHTSELDAADRVSNALGAAAHKTVEVDLRSFGGSALTDDIDVPEAGGPGIPVTYVPARNTIMLAVALGWAEVLAEHKLHERCDVLFSPSHAQVSPRELADWIVEARLPVRFQTQLHKALWGEEPGR